MHKQIHGKANVVKKFGQNLFLRESWIIWLVFLFIFVSHFFSTNVTPFDSRWTIYTTLSIIEEGNSNLDEYKEMLERNHYYFIDTIGDHFYTSFPIGTSVIAIPFVYVIDKVLKKMLFVGLDKIIRFRLPAGIEEFIASIIIALSSVFIYLMSHVLLRNRKYSLLMVFIFAFCTSSWSVVSRALWQHGPSMLSLTISLYLILLARERPWLIQFVGAILAFSYVVRPTNSISVIMIAILVLVEQRRYLVPYCLWSVVVLIPFVIFNLSVYNYVLPPYYLPGRLGTNSHFLEALAGNLFSPARGLFVFSPVFIFSLYGIFVKIQNRRMQKLDFFIVITIFLHLIVISSYYHWWGGHSFGPRFFSDMIPYFIYLMVPAIGRLSEVHGIRKVGFSLVLLCCIAISFFIHYRGANSWDVYLWNTRPVNVDANPERLWDWHDIQFLRGIR